MFDMGIWEITLIFVLLLVVVGPERLPKLARTIGLWVGKARSIVASVKAEVEQELKVEDLKRSIAQQTNVDEFRRLANQVKSINSDVASVGADIRRSTEKPLSSITPSEPVRSEDSAHATNDQTESSPISLTKKTSSTQSSDTQSSDTQSSDTQSSEK